MDLHREIPGNAKSSLHSDTIGASQGCQITLLVSVAQAFRPEAFSFVGIEKTSAVMYLPCNCYRATCCTRGAPATGPPWPLGARGTIGASWCPYRGKGHDTVAVLKPLDQ